MRWTRPSWTRSDYTAYTLIFLAYEGAIMAQAVTALTHFTLRSRRPTGEGQRSGV